MELKEGYKQTEVGVLPEEWALSSLGDTISRIIGGGTPCTDRPEFWGGNIPWATVKDFSTFSPLSTQEYITELGVKNSATHLIPAGTFILSTRMAIGRGVIYSVDVAINQDLKAIFFKKFIDVIFIFYWFQKNEKLLQEVGNGSTVKGISLEQLKKIHIAVPLLTEQKTIASVLSDVDALLSSLDALISKKRDIKKAAMQELLTGKKRLPGFSGEWVEKPLSSLAMIVGGGTPSTREPSYWYGSIPWFTPAEISTAGKYVSQSERQISELGLENSSAKLLPAGAILLTTRASIGFRAILTVPAATNQGFQSLIVNRNTDNEFIYYLLEIVQSELLAQASGSTFLEISPRKLGAISLRLPASIGEQRAIAAVLSDMDAEIAALEARRAKVLALKQGMMQELLTGRTRLLPAGE